MAEFHDVLGEVEAIADRYAVDLVLVSGDVWDRPIPQMDAFALGLETLLRLADRRPVVVVAGNHDSADLFEALAPLLRPRGAPDRRHQAPRRGRAARARSARGPAVVAGFPFLREGRVVDFMREAGEWYRAYADRVAAVTRSYNEALVAAAGADVVPILMAHFMVGGVKVDRGAPRASVSCTWATRTRPRPRRSRPGHSTWPWGTSTPPRECPAPPSPRSTPGRCSPWTSARPGRKKRVVVVDAEPGQLATIECLPLTAGRPLVRVTGDWDSIEARSDELGGAFLDLTVKTSGTDLTLADRARDAFPFLVKVRAWRPEGERRERLVKGHRTWDELYADYFTREHAEAAPEELLALFRDVLDEAADAPT